MNVRNKGHRYERELVHKFRKLGFEHIVTSRSESKSRDDLLVDLMNKDEGEVGRLPFNIQAKSFTGRVQYEKILDEMPEGKHPNIIFHKFTVKTEKLFKTIGEYAICDADFMRELLRNYFLNN